MGENCDLKDTQKFHSSIIIYLIIMVFNYCFIFTMVGKPSDSMTLLSYLIFVDCYLVLGFV